MGAEGVVMWGSKSELTNDTFINVSACNFRIYSSLAKQTNIFFCSMLQSTLDQWQRTLQKVCASAVCRTAMVMADACQG